jgi:hypothetical protein
LTATAPTDKRNHASEYRTFHCDGADRQPLAYALDLAGVLMAWMDRLGADTN